MKIETMAVHAGEAVDPTTRASSPNLVMSATFLPRELTGFSALDEDESAGYIYARSGNPTVRQLEEKLAALGGAEDARCFASGSRASLSATGGFIYLNVRFGPREVVAARRANGRAWRQVPDLSSSCGD